MERGWNACRNLVSVVLPTQQFTAILLVMMRPGRLSGHVRSRRFPLVTTRAKAAQNNCTTY